MLCEPKKEHAWLMQLVGEWTFESECAAGADGQAQKFRGTETVRALGDLWIVGDGRGEMPGGGEGRMMVTLGYDPMKGRYVGTWVGSMMTTLWVYDGFMDDSGRVLTLEAQGPGFEDPTTTATYRDIIEIVGPDERTLTSKMKNDKGEWQQFMRATYTRKK